MIDLPDGLRLVLASSSPRRADLLSSVGLQFDVRPAEIDEAHRRSELPIVYVKRLSIEKADAIERGPNEIVIAADTTVEIDGRVLGKPRNDDEATEMLSLLSGRTHRVHTGVTVVASDPYTIVVTTVVTFTTLTGGMIARYVATGEPSGKAGGYAIQGAGAALVTRIDGSVSNVIGLPLAETLALIRECSVGSGSPGVPPLSGRRRRTRTRNR